MLTGANGRISSKRVLGLIVIITVLVLTILSWIGVRDYIPEYVMMALTLLGGGLLGVGVLEGKLKGTQSQSESQHIPPGTHGL